jgi:DNA-binding GntR family transcriptional regulator
LRAVGLGFEPNYRLPLTQPELADTAGLSNVHIYRVLADLRKDGLIESGRRYISVPDVKRLENFARFDASYLMRVYIFNHSKFRLETKSGVAIDKMKAERGAEWRDETRGTSALATRKWEYMRT